MRRKRFQRGSLAARKRKGKNYWYAQWREEHKPKSKELGLCSQMSRGEAEAMLAEILEPVNEGAGLQVQHNYTAEKFITGVYLPVMRDQWKASTGMTEENRIMVHLVRPLGGRFMKEITREEMQALLNSKAKNLSASGINHLRFRLRSIFELALSEGVMDRNPATTLFSPRRCKPGREKRVMTWDEVKHMLDALDLREKLVARLGIHEGMRPGEILALQVGDVDVNSVWVNRRLYRGNIDSPKSKRSARQVALSEGSAALLGVWLEKVSTDPAAWLFPSETLETPIRRDNIWRRSMYPKLKEAGLEWATFQVMRRTYATLSKQAGVDAHTRSAQMGNTVDVNENEYAVSTFEERLKAVRRLETAVIQ